MSFLPTLLYRFYNSLLNPIKLYEAKLDKVKSEDYLKRLTNSIYLWEEKGKKEVIQTLNKRITSPFYVPMLSLICALLFIKSKKFYLNKESIFLYGFILLLFTELAVRYTGISKIILIIFNLLPLITTVIFYIFLSYYFSKETIKS